MPSISDPPPSGRPTPRITLTAEGGGHVATCECRWLRWFPRKGDAAETGRSHATKCNGAPEKAVAPAPKRARSTNWKDREGATWIDKL